MNKNNTNRQWKLGDIFRIKNEFGNSIYRLPYKKDGKLMVYMSEDNTSFPSETLGYKTFEELMTFYTSEFNPVKFICNIYDIGISMNNVVKPPAVKPTVTPPGHYTATAEWHEPILNRKKKQVGLIVGRFGTSITPKGRTKVTPLVGWSLCHPTDRFDSEEGLFLARQSGALGSELKIPISVKKQHDRMLRKMVRRANRLNQIMLDS